VAPEVVIEWGSYKGRRRRPCPERPELLAGAPIGMYHCPYCLMMVVAALPHPSPAVTAEQRNDPLHPLDDYEDEYQRPWPLGYES
jgi:hypothetical protein